MNAAIDTSTKQRVMDAALRTFAEKGYTGASIRDIAAEAGVTKPMVYYHFGSKAGLYQALLDQVLDESLADLKALQPGGACSEYLMRIIGYMINWAANNTDKVRLITQTYSTAPGQIPPEIDFRSRMRARFDWLESVIQQGIDRGEFACQDAELMTISIMGQAHFMVTGLLVMPPGERVGRLANPESLPRAIVDLFLAGAGKAARPELPVPAAR